MTRSTILLFAAVVVGTLSAERVPATAASARWILAPGIRTPASAASPAAPETHAVELDGDWVTVRSAGLSLHDLGPFQAPPAPVERLRRLEFRIPATPRPAADEPVSVRPDVLGLFLNGQPIYNPMDAASHGGRNLWRYDWTARLLSGDEPVGLGMLAGLLQDSKRHSPMLGFAFDGSPVYGPWGYDEDGVLRRMRSSYRLRPIADRTTWPDGTELTPAQVGPSLADAPLGTFVEDYEYVEGAGDLDRSNGRWAVTPDYPDGVYAYYLSVDETGGTLAFPYLIGPVYGRAVRAEELRAAFQDLSAPAPTPSELSPNWTVARSGDLRLSRSAQGRHARLSFEALDEDGNALRNLEWVHERPLHLLVVSEDLSRFDHIHPELRGGARYVVEHEFPAEGDYRLYADYTPPGGATRVESFRVSVGESSAAPVALEPESKEATTGPLRVSWSADQPLTAGRDLELSFEVRDAASGLRIPDLEPYLGAWGHFVLIREGHDGFIHAHPIEDGATAAEETAPHVHGAGAEATGPPPGRIRVAVNFSRAGRYKMWSQFQMDGEVHTAPFVLHVAASEKTAGESVEIPADAVTIQIEPSGYSPSRVELEADRAATLAFVRSEESNCGRRVVFPELEIEVEVEPGATALVEVPAHAAGELAFSCGMGMYRGALVLTANR